eukprot:101778-Amphidinium_carterae.2
MAEPAPYGPQVVQSATELQCWSVKVNMIRMVLHYASLVAHVVSEVLLFAIGIKQHHELFSQPTAGGGSCICSTGRRARHLFPRS